MPPADDAAMMFEHFAQNNRPARWVRKAHTLRPPAV
jgi:hypothetical protein